MSVCVCVQAFLQATFLSQIVADSQQVLKFPLIVHSVNLQSYKDRFSFLDSLPVCTPPTLLMNRYPLKEMSQK